MRRFSSMGALEAVADLGRLLAQSRSLDVWLQEAMRVTAEGAQAASAVLLEWRPERHAFLIRASHGLAVPPEAAEFPPPDGSTALQLLRGASGGALTHDLPSWPAEPPLLAERGLHAAAMVAIPTADPFGVLAVYADATSRFGADTLALLRAVAALLAAGVAHSRVAAALDRERDERFGLASLVAGSDDAIVSATLDGTVLSWNPGAERLYGYTAAEMVGGDVSMLIPAERERDRRHLMHRVRAGQRIPAFDAVHYRRDGSPITVSLSLSPVCDQHGEVVAVAGIAHDVTETRRLEADLRQIAKMEAVGGLAGGLAHDFNNMLTVIDGYSELVLMKLPSDHPVRGLVEEIHRAGERAAELTRQLMVFSRKSMVEPQVLDVSEVVSTSVEMLTRIIGEDVRIEMQLDEAVAHVVADRSQLEQVLVNLVINARDAMPTGGEIRIRTRLVDRPTGFSSPHEESEQYVVLSVADTGIGMDAATRARIFEPFFTTKGSGRGTGLGLAMLQRFVMQSGGRVEVESEPGRGTVFHLYLPTVPVPASPRAARAAAEAPSGSEMVLVVEDDEAVRQLTEVVLTAAGYQVRAAANGPEALALAAADGRSFDLLISDVVMPVLNGQAVAERFLATHPRARVLFTSGYTPEAVGRRGFSIDPQRFLQKPYSPAALCRQVRAVLDRPETT